MPRSAILLLLRRAPFWGRDGFGPGGSPCRTSPPAFLANIRWRPSQQTEPQQPYAMNYTDEVAQSLGVVHGRADFINTGKSTTT